MAHGGLVLDGTEMMPIFSSTLNFKDSLTVLQSTSPNQDLATFLLEDVKSISNDKL